MRRVLWRFEKKKNCVIKNGTHYRRQNCLNVKKKLTVFYSDKFTPADSYLEKVNGGVALEGIF